eukprot:9432201-Lingulodinium_polyedra.AAC.1
MRPTRPSATICKSTSRGAYARATGSSWRRCSRSGGKGGVPTSTPASPTPSPSSSGAWQSSCRLGRL